MRLLSAEEAESILEGFRDIISASLADHAGEDPAIIMYDLQGLLVRAYIHERAYDKHLSFQLRAEG